ncbi:phage tail protein [Mixta calida]|uniref:phage tail protein n=1 Tax=Mixta calida TaxID=665913 RepID=UPI0034D53FEE
MAENYRAILTDRGCDLEAEAVASGSAVTLTHFIVGDGAGQTVSPEPSQTRLVNEQYRGEIADLTVSPDQANQLVARLVIPAGVGGFVIRELGLLTAAGELYSVANCPVIEKPVTGVAVTLQYRLAVNTTDTVMLNESPGDGLFLRIDANLEDLRDKEAARKNLGLGSAALMNVQASLTDETAENVMKTGAFGLGGNRITVTDRLHSYFPGKPSGFYGGGGDIGDRQTTGWFDAVWIQHGTEGRYGVLIEIGSGGQVARHIWDNGIWSVHKLYNDYSKCPVIGAYPGPFAFAQQYDSSAAFYEDFTTTGTSEYHPLIKQRARLPLNPWVFSMGVLVSGTALSWRLHIKGAGLGEWHHSWDTSGNYTAPGQVIPGNYANFDSRYYTKANADARYYTRTLSDDRYYTKAASDGRYYTRTDSDGRYYQKTVSDSRYIQGMRFGAAVQYNERSNNERMSGGVMTSWADRGSSNYWVKLRPLQYLINGSWHTAAYT